MTGKTRLALAGLLAGTLALGTTSMRAEARPSPQDLLQQQQQQGGSTGTDDTGTGGAGADDQTDDPALDEPGTGGAGDTGQDRVGDEDEGVLRDEGLDHQEGQADQDTVNPPGTSQPQR